MSLHKITLLSIWLLSGLVSQLAFSNQRELGCAHHVIAKDLSEKEWENLFVWQARSFSYLYDRINRIDRIVEALGPSDLPVGQKMASSSELSDQIEQLETMQRSAYGQMLANSRHPISTIRSQLQESGYELNFDPLLVLDRGQTGLRDLINRVVVVDVGQMSNLGSLLATLYHEQDHVEFLRVAEKAMPSILSSVAKPLGKPGFLLEELSTYLIGLKQLLRAYETLTKDHIKAQLSPQIVTHIERSLNYGIAGDFRYLVEFVQHSLRMTDQSLSTIDLFLSTPRESLSLKSEKQSVDILLPAHRHVGFDFYDEGTAIAFGWFVEGRLDAEEYWASPIYRPQQWSSLHSMRQLSVKEQDLFKNSDRSYQSVSRVLQEIRPQLAELQSTLFFLAPRIVTLKSLWEQKPSGWLSQFDDTRAEAYRAIEGLK